MRKLQKIPGYRGYYVDRTGHVYSRWQRVHVVGKTGSAQILGTEFYKLKPWIAKHGGYPSVALVSKGKRRTFCIYKLVLLAFRGPCPEGYEGCHDDGNPLNSKLSNLYYGTHSNNMQDAARHGRTNRGTKCHASKLNPQKVAYALAEVNSGRSQQSVADELGVCQQSIQCICTGRTWSHLTGIQN